MRSLLLLIVIFTIPGCAGLNFDEPKRWVESGRFYSTKLPSIKIEIERDIPFQREGEGEKYIKSDRSGLNSNIKRENFYFSTDNTDLFEGLTIRVETLNDQNRVYFSIPNYANFTHSISSGEEILAGMRFSTGIYVFDKKEYANLTKVYGRVFADTTRFQIYYFERVGRDWLEKNPKWLTEEESDLLKKFERRAKTSFSIKKYDGTSSPSTL